jgi:hypothetical protein
MEAQLKASSRELLPFQDVEGRCEIAMICWNVASPGALIRQWQQHHWLKFTGGAAVGWAVCIQALVGFIQSSAPEHHLMVNKS